MRMQYINGKLIFSRFQNSIFLAIRHRELFDFALLQWLGTVERTWLACKLGVPAWAAERTHKAPLVLDHWTRLANVNTPGIHI